MLINSELPICMLDRNNDLNEYDFVLFHLYISNKEYREFYWKQRLSQPNRLMILDNSAYEFFNKGETLDMDAFVRVINELQPDMYILPDTLMNMDKTLKDTREFLSKYNITCSKPLAVAQGNTANELTACILLYQDMGIKNIAIPFHNSFFKDSYEDYVGYLMMNKYAMVDMTDDMKYACGRIKWVRDNRGLLKQFHHVHLLGSHCPYEKVFYMYDPINTMDTGYPVKCAIEGYELFKEPHKPNIIIDDFLNKDLDCKELIANNVSTFKNLY